MKFGIVVFPGSNCDQDMVHVLQEVMDADVIELWHKDHDLHGLGKGDCVIIPGGFSYGDYLRCGAIARFSPIMKSVIEFAENGGYVFGICNGFQVLCESGLLPGALLRNNNQLFICQNQYLRVETTNSAITRNCQKGQVLNVPIAHAEGRYYADEKTLLEMEMNDQIIFRYCDKEGNVNDQTNPNGAINGIAGICNKQRNVFGMMPHPERASEVVLGNTDGRILFESILEILTQV
ncbi:MAG: phosphoribosylformylglycinamidine synthase subunit PurQ [Chitinophagales bacterium]|nr:phosphoribosylformylglycinamidine synthase subunit PurQ [Chitinophagales bacterium]